MSKAAHEAFIEAAGSAAKKSEKETGVPASVTVAQAILESGWGEAHMGDANNYFGIKAQVRNRKVEFGDVARGYVNKITKEYDKNGRAYTVVAHFRAHKSMADSFLDHGLFVTSKRYRKALDAYAKSKDADEFAHGLQRAGYATDPQSPSCSYR